MCYDIAMSRPPCRYPQVRRLWVQAAGRESDEEALARMFEAAAEAAGSEAAGSEVGSEAAGSEAAGSGVGSEAAGSEVGSEAAGSEVVSEAAGSEVVARWRESAAQWQAFEHGFARLPSLENAPAVASLASAMGALSELAESSALSELQRHLVLSRLCEGGKMLARGGGGGDARGAMRDALRWHRELVRTPLCRENFAVVETQPSCWNDQLAAAITLHRRLNDTAGAEELVRAGRGHPHAATQWTSSAQTPRVFAPTLEATPWWDPQQPATLLPCYPATRLPGYPANRPAPVHRWDPYRFGVAAALEAAWASGEIGDDLRRLGVATEAAAGAATGAAPGAPFDRIVSTGLPLRAPAGTDGGGPGAWSEFMLFDATRWLPERCALAHALCRVLRAAAEVSGRVPGSDGAAAVEPQGQVTIFRLVPGAHVLPHVGVTNRRLVLQFPLAGHEGVRFRVDDEWRGYEEGRAMVFDGAPRRRAARAARAEHHRPVTAP